MKDTKLTVRVSRDLLENAKLFAEKNNTTLTSLIEAFLQNIPNHYNLDNANIVRRLSGILPQDVNLQDYKNHLEQKYGS